VQGTSAAAGDGAGSRMLVWLGNAPDGPTVGATYDPARRAWRRIAPSPIGLDRARADHVQREQRGRARGTRWGGL
jgi:hypothetical protein